MARYHFPMDNWDANVTLNDLRPEDIFRPNAFAEIDSTRSWVDPQGYRLSDRLWRSKAADRAQIDQVLREGLAKGASPLQTARALEGMLNPYYQPRRDPKTFRVLPKSRQPKGVATVTPYQGPGRGPLRPRNSGVGSYAARRLARTETTRAFGDAAIKAAKANPVLEKMRWRLSGNHPDADQCDLNAENSSRGLPKGVYWVDELPQYPDHPHEMCTLTPYINTGDLWHARQRLREYVNTGVMPDRTWLAPTGGVKLLPPAIRVDPKPKRTRKPKPTPAPVEPVYQEPPGSRYVEKSGGPQWAKDVRAAGNKVMEQFRAGQGVNEAELRRIGGMVRQQIGSTNGPRLHRELNQIKSDIAAYARDLNTSRYGPARHDPQQVQYREAVERRIETLKAQRAAKYQEILDDGYSDRVRAALKEVRTMADETPKVKHTYKARSSKETKGMIDTSQKNFPADWWAESVDHNTINTKKVERGYYREGPRGGESNIMVSGEGEYAQDVMTHELTHRMEYRVPFVNQAERAFYERRTAGEQLQHLDRLFPGYGYGRDELARPDNFAEIYSGKDYGGRAWEVMTMGNQDLTSAYGAPSWIAEDEDYLDFVLGVMAVGR